MLDHRICSINVQIIHSHSKGILMCKPKDYCRLFLARDIKASSINPPSLYNPFLFPDKNVSFKDH